MRLYLDTSALVKLYVSEEGAAQVRAAVDRAESVATSSIAYVEARAAFARRHREGGISSQDHRRTVRRFNLDWPHLVRLEATESLIRAAARAAEVYRLRAYDALHLTSALIFRDRVGGSVVFACYDEGLMAAASRAGLVLL